MFVLWSLDVVVCCFRDQIGCALLFICHYDDITHHAVAEAERLSTEQLERTRNAIVFYQVAYCAHMAEGSDCEAGNGHEITLLYTMQKVPRHDRGGIACAASSSFGLHAALLAGVPERVLATAARVSAAYRKKSINK